MERETASTSDQKSALRKQIIEEFQSLAAEGLIYDSGERRNGQVVWRLTPGKEAEAALLLRTWDLADGSEE